MESRCSGVEFFSCGSSLGPFIALSLVDLLCVEVDGSRHPIAAHVFLVSKPAGIMLPPMPDRDDRRFRPSLLVSFGTYTRKKLHVADEERRREKVSDFWVEAHAVQNEVARRNWVHVLLVG